MRAGKRVCHCSAVPLLSQLLLLLLPDAELELLSTGLLWFGKPASALLTSDCVKISELCPLLSTAAAAGGFGCCWPSTSCLTSSGKQLCGCTTCQLLPLLLAPEDSVLLLSSVLALSLLLLPVCGCSAALRLSRAAAASKSRWRFPSASRLTFHLASPAVWVDGRDVAVLVLLVAGMASLLLSSVLEWLSSLVLLL